MNSSMKKFNKSDRYYKFFLYCTITILLGVFLTAVVACYLFLQNIKIVLERIEDTQKANVCIFLIPPEKRTHANTTNCVESNRTEKKEFKFNGDKDSSPPTQRTTSTPPPTPTKTVIVPKPTKEEPLKVVDEPTVEVKPVVKVEHRVNVDGLDECRVLGDVHWVLGKEC